MKQSLCLVLMLALLSGCDGTGAAPESGSEAPDKRPSYFNSVGMLFLRIPAGSFTMGSAEGDADERPSHRVTFQEDFFMAAHEVTQGQWHAVMGQNPSWFTGDDTRPVDRVTWFDAQTFIEALNQREGGRFYRLPTEAEWEYAARGRSNTAYFFGDGTDQLNLHAWHRENAGEQTQPVGRKQPNAFGLYDMSGNVWEWVQDWYGAAYYKGSFAENPQGPATGIVRVIRGGSGNDFAPSLRSANRGGSRPTLRDEFLGFRLVWDASE